MRRGDAAWTAVSFPDPGQGRTVPSDLGCGGLQARRFADLAACQPAFDQFRRVYDHGGVSLEGRRIKLSKAFKGLDVAFRHTPVDGVWDVFFMRFRIAEIDLRDPNAHGACVRRVSEHLSGTSPV